MRRSVTSPDMTFPTAGWGPHPPMDTFNFPGVSGSPATVTLHGTVNFPISKLISHPLPDTWYPLCMGVVTSYVLFHGEIGVEESTPAVERLQCLNVSPSVVTGQMTVRLQPVGTGRPVVEIHDAVGNVIRSLNCTAGANGAATATCTVETSSDGSCPKASTSAGMPLPAPQQFARFW